MKHLALALLMGFLIGAETPSQALTIVPAVEFTTSSTVNDYSQWTLGYSFSLSAPVTVNALGYWSGGDVENHEVGIWTSGGSLLTSTTVLGSATPIGHFRWGEISDITLGAGSYVIGGEFNRTVFPKNAISVTTIPQYSYGADRFFLTTALAFPTDTAGTFGSNGILVVSFLTTTPVPEASVWAMLLLGLGAVGKVLRRSTRLAPSL